jgi:CRP-like cAMP-binding protein
VATLLTAVKIPEIGDMRPATTPLVNHPERSVTRLQLKQHKALEGLNDDDRAELETHLAVIDARKGDFLLHQGACKVAQHFILDGILKRVVSNQDGKDMILRFADERDMETRHGNQLRRMARGYTETLRHRLHHQGTRGLPALARMG